jgi:hypothetical protein
MGAGYSEVQIYNLVFDHLEEEVAVTIDDQRAPVKWLRRNFPIHRDAMIRRGQWGFARKRVTLAKDPTPPAFEWLNRYVVPADSLRILPITYFSRTGWTPVPLQVESGYILTNLASPANLVYMRRVETTGDFDPLFTLALAARMALLMAHWMTGKISYVQSLKEIYSGQLTEALEIEQVEMNFQVPYDDELLLARE